MIRGTKARARLLGLALAALAGIPGAGVPAAAGPFEAWETGLEAGILLPMGDLADILDPAPMAGARVSMGYHGPWRTAGTLSYARLDGAASPASVDYAAAAAGLAWRPPRPWLPGAEAALALHYVRAAEVSPKHGGYLFLEDGESEFGARAALLWDPALGRSVRLSAGARWDVLFSGPAYSHLATLLLGVAWIL